MSRQLSSAGTRMSDTERGPNGASKIRRASDPGSLPAAPSAISRVQASPRACSSGGRSGGLNAQAQCAISSQQQRLQRAALRTAPATATTLPQLAAGSSQGQARRTSTRSSMYTSKPTGLRSTLALLAGAAATGAASCLAAAFLPRPSLPSILATGPAAQWARAVGGVSAPVCSSAQMWGGVPAGQLPCPCLSRLPPSSGPG